MFGKNSAVHMKDEVADEIGRILEFSTFPLIGYSQLLMPHVIERHGLTHQCFSAISIDASNSLRDSCDRCPSSSKCWHALRSDAGASAWREFCPNSESFEQLRSHATSE